MKKISLADVRDVAVAAAVILVAISFLLRATHIPGKTQSDALRSPDSELYWQGNTLYVPRSYVNWDAQTTVWEYRIGTDLTAKLKANRVFLPPTLLSDPSPEYKQDFRNYEIEVADWHLQRSFPAGMGGEEPRFFPSGRYAQDWKFNLDGTQRFSLVGRDGKLVDLPAGIGRVAPAPVTIGGEDIFAAKDASGQLVIGKITIKKEVIIYKLSERIR